MLKRILLASTMAVFAISASHAAHHRTLKGAEAPAPKEACQPPEALSKALEGRGFKVTNDLTGELLAAFRGRVAKEMPTNPLPDAIDRLVILHSDGNESLLITAAKGCGVGIAVVKDSLLAKLLDDGAI